MFENAFIPTGGAAWPPAYPIVSEYLLQNLGLRLVNTHTLFPICPDEPRLVSTN